MATPVADPEFHEKVRTFRNNLRTAVDDLVAAEPGLGSQKRDEFVALVGNIENFSYGKTDTNFGIHVPAVNYGGARGVRGREIIARRLKDRVFNEPPYGDRLNILQHAVASAFRDDNNFRNTYALDVIETLLACQFVDPHTLSPENMAGKVPDEQTDVSEWIEHSSFLEKVGDDTSDSGFSLRNRWWRLAGVIELRLENDGRESPTLL